MLRVNDSHLVVTVANYKSANHNNVSFMLCWLDLRDSLSTQHFITPLFNYCTYENVGELTCTPRVIFRYIHYALKRNLHHKIKSKVVRLTIPAVFCCSQATTTGSGSTSPSVRVLGWWSRWKIAFQREKWPSWNTSERLLKETGGRLILRVCMEIETVRANSET